MSDKSKIEWTDASWVTITGCQRVSPGCENCYSERLSARLQAMGNAKYQGVVTGTGKDARWTRKVFCHPDALAIPLRWKRPRMIFVNSMSDTFHADVPEEFIAEMFAVMALAPQHTFQVLTKRADRMRDVLSDDFAPKIRAAFFRLANAGVVPHTIIDGSDSWYPLANVWLGVSVENQEAADARIPALLRTPAAIRWLSCEPLLGPVTRLDRYMRTVKSGHVPEGPHGSWEGPTYDTRVWSGGLGACPTPCFEFKSWCGCGIDWVVVGGESGFGARPMEHKWAQDIGLTCKSLRVPFFMKQGSAANWPHYKDFASFPADLQVREYPIPRAAPPQGTP